MDELLAWGAAALGRHFVVKMGGTYTETRWRVLVWEKQEGEVIRGIPGEGYGITAESAVKDALAAWERQLRMPRKTGTNWYVPVNVANRIGSEE